MGAACITVARYFVSLNSSWNSPNCAIDKLYSMVTMELQKHVEEVLLAKQPVVGGLKWT
jgi:hypothetical protein